MSSSCARARQIAARLGSHRLRSADKGVLAVLTRYRLPSIIAALALALAPALALAAEAPQSRNVILMISDGIGFNGWLAADYYEGRAGARPYQVARPDGTRPYVGASAHYALRLKDPSTPSGMAFNPDVPDLATMSLAALNVLNQNPKGFFIMIEGGAVDWMAHFNQMPRVIEEQMDFNAAVAAVIDWVEAHSSWDETLLIVTSDHETGGIWGEPYGWDGNYVDNTAVFHVMNAAFGKTCQKAMGANEGGMARKVAPMIKDAKLGGSTDVADVSWNTPVAVFGWPTYPLGVNLHNWAVTACGGMSIGDKGSVAAAAILAAVGYELMTEPELRTKARAEWKRRLDGRKYQAVQNMDLRELEEVSTRCQKGMGDEYVSGVDVK